MREAVARLIDPATLRWISWSHFEVDECGALNEWLAVAPKATPVVRRARRHDQHRRLLEPAATRPEGRRRAADGPPPFPLRSTPHLPHGWDAGVLFEESDRVLLCSDLLHQLGNVEPVTSSDVVGR